MNNLREELAALSHEQWSGWMKYMLDKGTFIDADGTWVMPHWAVQRWTRQATTHYTALTEEEKNSDRAEADRVLAVLAQQPPKIVELLDLDRSEAQLMREQIKENWGCDVTLEYAEALIRFIDRFVVFAEVDRAP